MDGGRQELDAVLVTPSGRIAPDLRGKVPDPGSGKAAAAFALSQAEGLFSLAALSASNELSPVLSFWQDFKSGSRLRHSRAWRQEVPRQYPPAGRRTRSEFASRQHPNFVVRGKFPP